MLQPTTHRPLSRAILARFILPGLIGLSLMAAASLATAQTRELSSSGEFLDGIAALVNDGVVLKSELHDETSRITTRLEKQGTQLPPFQTLQHQVLDRLIIQQLQLQRAAKVGIKVSDETLNQALGTIAQRNNISLSELPNMLAREGENYASYRRELRDQITIDQLRQRDVLQRINVSPSELESYLARQQGKAGQREEYLLSHILVSIPANATPAQVETAEKQADELHQRLENGEDFAKLAVAYSSGQQALEGGKMDWLKGNELPTIFADVVPKMTKGAISKPIRNSSGFHLVKLLDKRGNTPVMEDQVHARHILLTTNELMDDSAVKQKLEEIRTRILGGEDFAAVAKAVSEDPQSAVDGGDLGWTGPQAFVPEFEAQLARLKPDEISEPFHTQYGWHIVQVLGRRTYDATADRQRQEAIMAIRNSKLNDEVDRWTRQLRDEAFVEYRM
ncbi:MAG: molecular chaperone SurA [Gammaproteobacteria bacterium PRO9]|nr:molecular chaperone SurA [Gammaproteobacteria bacterium PRO9]